MSTKGIVALLPMKANSERVRGKNFKRLAGKPLYAWMLDTLLSVPDISCVVINTDARAMLIESGTVQSDRVLIRDRQAKLCGDQVSMNLVLADDVAAVSADIYLMTHTTNPLLSPQTICRAVDAFHTSAQADSLFSVTKHQTRYYDAEARAINHDPSRLLRTQDLPPYYEENSALYLFSAASFAKTGARIGEAPLMFETPKLESIDIDEPEDWFIAESLAMRIVRGEKLAA